MRLIALVAIALSMASTSGSATEQSRYYDERGRSLGTASTDSQGTTTFRDAQGRMIGKATTTKGREAWPRK
jgi:YD repeat-containing protein